ncbi:probable peroxisomal acyl-coenzyme A oxidase 1 [Teleopsis dalmanni]|uniref:probable peroxisomal acyl-coenzyme A oxidase 1 n=1 Tax=Teleopsis dalmanni TaxID=139649 RepID=UPI0018CF3984|nr:probable peroxisomal acyl-coenzyme A oxidase 1 [Teleopsis dalmanni]
MSEKSLIPSTVNPDLQKERNSASFNVEEFATWWHGGAEKLKFKRELENYMFKDMEEDNHLTQYKSHADIYEQAVKQAIDAAKKLRKLQEERNPGGIDIWPELYNSSLLWGAMPAGNPFGVQFVMLVTALKAQGTDEQYADFGKRAANFEICGTYAQTELGHGTFLRGLETRADYDRKTDEFILNSPTLSSYKWWPGGLGHSSNYCIVVAQLFIDNEAKGVEMFFVQVRDEETHMPLPGIDIGEIGKKVGFFGVNNGYLGLKNVRIPRTKMLMRNAKVFSDGTFVKSPASVLTYFTMVSVRCIIARDDAIMLTMAATIATRYSAVRRQSPINPNDPEPQIIDHVTQQLKLFPEIATGVAYRLASDYLMSLFDITSNEIERGEYGRLPEMHALSCILKVLCSYDATEGVERLRLACGGHGYLTSAHLATLYVYATASITYEGENTVLLLQVGRFLMKTWRNAISGKPLSPTTSYLVDIVKNNSVEKWSGTWENMVKHLEFVAANKTRTAFESLTQRLKAGQSEAEAANNTGIELIQAAESHGRAFVCATFLAQVRQLQQKQSSPALQKVMGNLLELYLVNTVLKQMTNILRFVRLSETELRTLQTRLEKALIDLRPDAVAICDGFDYHDRTLSSTLGSYDGNVYERLFEAAKKSPLNQQPVPKAFHEHLKPFMKSNL